MELKKEKSCGCVIVENDKVLLILQQNDAYWGFPKGHVENGETEIQTAKREVKEEVGLDVEIDENKRYVTNYIVRNEIDKTSVFYTATTTGGELIKQDSEIKEVKWCTFEEALELLTFDNLKEVLRNVMTDMKK